MDADGSYSLLVDSAPAFSSPSFTAAPPLLCVGGVFESLAVVGQAPASGVDPLGAWTGTDVTLKSSKTSTPVVHTFRAYPGAPSLLTSAAAFPAGVPGGGSCGANTAVRTSFPQFNTSDAMAPTLGFFSWRASVLSQLPAAVGLANLNQNTLDSGPVVAFFNGRPGVPHPGIVWSTLSSHKVVTQATAGGAQGTTPAPLTALWSSQRAEQVACLSELCAQDQVASGAYAPARVEGYGFSALGGDAPAGSACANGATFPVAKLSFAWSEAKQDNFVGANASSALPDASYAVMGDDGWVVAAAGVPGTVPLFAARRVYGASHTDWAAVASPEGRAWAAQNGYTTEFTIGYVFTAKPAPCAAGGGGGTYTAGLSAAVPEIPAGWSYSHIYSVADGGPTAAVYAWGAAIQTYLGTARLPSVTLSDVGYYTDDGACALFV